MPMGLSLPGRLEAVFERIDDEWGELGYLVHSIAFAPMEDIQGVLLDCSAEGFAKIMDISCPFASTAASTSWFRADAHCFCGGYPRGKARSENRCLISHDGANRSGGLSPLRLRGALAGVIERNRLERICSGPAALEKRLPLTTTGHVG